jgi:tRNA-specific adenosine deaminase 3
LPDFRTSEISHLRRVVQFKYLPPHLQKQFYPPTRVPRGDEDDPALASLSSSLASPPTHQDSDPATDTLTEHFDLVRYFLLCPTRYLAQTDLSAIIRTCPPFDGKTALPRIFHVTVPALAPISADQATEWSNSYWPISYKNTNPYGPHPSLVQRNQDEIQPGAGRYLGLARLAGQQISHECLGEDIGVAVVDHTKLTPEVIVVAGDCRWRSFTGTAGPHAGTGNVMAHAVLRAIAMVAKKRLRAAGTDPVYLDRPLFCDNPLTPVEEAYFEKNNIQSSGYLCVDLDIYLTHEPCVMCSMAILHSRFRRCIFAKRMPNTGGMTSDSPDNSSANPAGLRNGLFWRPNELNWKFLAWEFKEDGKLPHTGTSLKDTLHA